jgi:hypothetical protein
MARETYVFDPVSCELVDRDTYYTRRPAAKRSDLPAPMVMSDGIEVKSMVDGKIYTSKAALRQSYRAKGYVEVGNETLKAPPKPKPDRKAISESVGKAFARAGISL